jgi:hypothetical protein
MEKNEMGGACGTCGRQERCVHDFGGRSERMGVLEKYTPRWEDNITMGLEGVGWGGMNWIDLAEERDR